MKLISKTFILGVFSFALVATSFADITGKWSGKVTLETKDQKMAQQVKAQGAMPTVALEFKSDKTYKATQTGGPDKATHVSEGTWAVSGSSVTLTPKKRDGKAISGEMAKPKVYTLSKDGKSMTYVQSAMARAPKDGKQAPAMDVKVRVTLTKKS